MYCSLRVYIDKVNRSVNAQNILDIFEVFEIVLCKSYDYISYILFDPDRDRTLIDEKYSYDSIGKNRFLNTDILPVFVGKSGDMSSPFIGAYCASKSTQLYSKIRVQIQFPDHTQPFVIRVDYEQKEEEKLTLEKYAYLMKRISSIGFHVNNSFYHVYAKKGEVFTLDGGQCGSLLTYYERNNLKNSVMHRKAGCINRFMDIYCVNSICTEWLDVKTRQQIEDIVGSENTVFDAEIFSFSTGSLQNLTSRYRVRDQRVIRKLRHLLLESNNKR